MGPRESAAGSVLAALTTEPQDLYTIVGKADVHPVRAAIVLGRLCGDWPFCGMAVRDGDGRWRLRDDGETNAAAVD